ncbi:unnamed protein product [Camellia sinensis]
MGRVKLKIKRLESISNQQVTYLRRKNGILKKDKELSILCDIDIVLLMFSPTGKATLFRRERSNIEEVITKFAQLTPQERTKRKLESLEALKKTFKNTQVTEKSMVFEVMKKQEETRLTELTTIGAEFKAMQAEAETNGSKEDGRKAWKSPPGPSEKDKEFFEDKLSSSAAALDNLHNQMKTSSLRFESSKEIVGNYML